MQDGAQGRCLQGGGVQMRMRYSKYGWIDGRAF